MWHSPQRKQLPSGNEGISGLLIWVTSNILYTAAQPVSNFQSVTYTYDTIILPRRSCMRIRDSHGTLLRNTTTDKATIAIKTAQVSYFLGSTHAQHLHWMESEWVRIQHNCIQNHMVALVQSSLDFLCENKGWSSFIRQTLETLQIDTLNFSRGWAAIMESGNNIFSQWNPNYLWR